MRLPNPAEAHVPAMPRLPWYERLNAFNLTLLVFLLAVIGSSQVMEGSGRALPWGGNFRRFAARFFPPDWSILPDVGVALLETVQIAIMATFFSVGISTVLAVMAARNITPRWLNVVTRLLLNAIRTIPSLIWALLAVVVVGPSPLAGVLALTAYSVGYLGKFFSDAFESVDPMAANALKAAGAHPVQAFQYGMWPHARPLIWSHTLWMLEYNIRSGSIIGYVGAGGIGVLLHTYQEFGSWDRFSTVLLCILFLVSVLDFFGEWLRSRLKRP